MRAIYTIQQNKSIKDALEKINNLYRLLTSLYKD